jgi:Spy/CpxP family protein refolding chaperone
MTDQGNTEAPAPAHVSPRPRPARSKTVLVAMALAVALVAGLTGSMLSTAFGQGFAFRHFAWQRDGLFNGPLSQAQIDDRIDRMTKHMAIELDATADQQAKIAGIAKAAVGDLRQMREHAEAARARALALLTAPTIDRAAIEQLRTDQMALADTASKRIVQAVADASDVLSAEQRRKVADWIVLFRGGGPFPPWHRG